MKEEKNDKSVMYGFYNFPHKGYFAKFDWCQWGGILSLLVLQLSLGIEMVNQSFIHCIVSL